MTSDTREHFKGLTENRRKSSRNRYKVTTFKFREEIKNGIKYFGNREKNGKNGEVFAVCICHCGNLWRTNVRRVIGGKVKSCGCSKFRKE